MSDNKGKAAWIEARDVCVVFIATCFQSNIFQSLRNFHLATPNPRASPIRYIAYVLTYGQATNGERFIIFVTPKVCISVTANGHELVLGVRNCENGDTKCCCCIKVVFQTRGGVVVTVKGFIHQDVNLALDGNFFNEDVPSHWLSFAGQIATIDVKISSFF